MMFLYFISLFSCILFYGFIIYIIIKEGKLDRIRVGDLGFILLLLAFACIPILNTIILVLLIFAGIIGLSAYLNVEEKWNEFMQKELWRKK